MKTREELTHLFQTGDCAHMICVHPRTINRWANNNRISFVFDEMMNRRLFPLEEINRIRGLQKMPLLTPDDAIAIWSGRHKNSHE